MNVPVSFKEAFFYWLRLGSWGGIVAGVSGICMENDFAGELIKTIK